MCITMVDCAIGILEIEEIPTIVIVNNEGATNNVFDKISAHKGRNVYKCGFVSTPDLGYYVH